MPPHAFGVQPVFVVGAPDGVQVGLAARSAGHTPVAELRRVVGGQQTGLEDTARVQGTGGFVMAGIVMHDEEDVRRGVVDGDVLERQGEIALFLRGVTKIRA